MADRDGEVDVLRAAGDEHADYAALLVERRPTRVARVRSGVRLDVGPRHAADDTGRDGALEAERTADEVRRWDDPTLDKEINEAYRALFTLRFQHASRQLQNYRELRNVRRRIARLRTIRRERQLAALEEQE